MMSGYLGLSWREWGMTVNAHQFSSWGDENVLKLDYYNGYTTPKISLRLNYTLKGGELYAM